MINVARRNKRVGLRVLQQQVEREERMEVFDGDRADLPPRPADRNECRDGPRPCPFVSCKYHLYLDVDRRLGTIIFNFPGLDPEQLAETCALDVADRGGVTLDEVGSYLNVTRERIRQIEDRCAKRIREVMRSLYEIDPDEYTSMSGKAMAEAERRAEQEEPVEDEVA